MKNNKYHFDCIKYTLLIVGLTHATLSIAFNTESAMVYNFGHKVATKPSPRKISKKSKMFQKRNPASSKMDTATKPNIPRSKTSSMLKCPLVLKKSKHPIPVKIVPQFGSVTPTQTTNADYLYNGIFNSRLYLNYDSTIFSFSQNSINITYPLDKPHNQH